MRLRNRDASQMLAGNSAARCGSCRSSSRRENVLTLCRSLRIRHSDPNAVSFEEFVLPGPPILTANDLALAYGYQRLLEAVTLSVAAGEKVGLVGRNGCGKTSLLRILAGHQQADGGEVARRRGLRIGYLPQEFELDPKLTVRQNIEAGAADLMHWLHRYQSGTCT